MEDSPPADPKVTERLEDYTDESGDLARIAKVSSRFEQNKQAIQTWAQNFGLQSEQAEYCQVQLDMIVEHDDWKAKDDVFAAVEAKVDRIVAFRQDEFQQVREMVRKKLEAEKIKVENTEVVAEEQPVDGADVKSSINGSLEKQEAEDAAQVASAERLSEAKSPSLVDAD